MATVGNGCELARLLLTLLIKIKIMNKNEFISESNLSVESRNVSAPKQCDHKLELSDGRTIVCYPKTDSLGGIRNLFINNAHFLWAHKDRILSDSRMYLCPLGDMGHNLSITGSGGFENPTLGVYIEWWLSVPETMLLSAEGRQSLVYMIAGSPLSGQNHCSAVAEDGSSHTVSLSPFGDYWRPFMSINRRHAEAKRQYQSYSLPEVLDILRREK